MALTKEQVNELKDQLRAQVDNLPEKQKSAALEQIESMSNEAIEAMLNQQQGKSSQPVFRSIVTGEIPSRIIDQNKEAVAVLDIKPVSKGHIIIIPKSPVTNVKDLPSQVLSLAKKLAKRISAKLQAKSSEIQTQFSFGEIIINIIPVYDKAVSINSPRQEAKEDELDEVYKTLRIIKKPKVIKLNTKPKISKIIRLKRRIP